MGRRRPRFVRRVWARVGRSVTRRDIGRRVDSPSATAARSRPAAGSRTAAGAARRRGAANSTGAPGRPLLPARRARTDRERPESKENQPASARWKAHWASLHVTRSARSESVNRSRPVDSHRRPQGFLGF
jgi:hypothetical protein